jgi:2-amino-4-hydroxy-6-hydroxymethyldihydropteridine diphosphokinase
MSRAFVGVGSNLGDRRGLIAGALRMLRETSGLTINRISPIYETEAEGGPPQGMYLNAVWEIETSLDCPDLLRELFRVEQLLGRRRAERNGPRTIDLDILFYENRIYRSEELTVPHPRLHRRCFVLRPMADLEPEWVHPGLNKTVRTLLEELDEENRKS